MENIHGVTFRDYACASANLVAGMSEEKIFEVLGIEAPLWAQVQEFWNNKMGEMSMEDMGFYGEVFTNPKQGKFANVEGAAAGPEEVLKKYPEWSDTIKMQMYMSEASNVGIEPDFEKEFQISLTEYSQLALHWSKYFQEKTDVASQTSEEIINDVEFSEEQKEASRVFALHGELSDKWELYYKEKFKDNAVNLSSDIDF